MVVVFGVIRIAFLLHKGPAAHVLQAPRWVASLNEADGLTGKRRREMQMQMNMLVLWQQPVITQTVKQE